MLSLAQVKSIENKRRRKERNPHTVLPVISPNTRYLRFWQSVQFRCIRSGILLPTGESPDTFREHLTYDHLWIYEHENGSILDRTNKDTPRFIGCLKLHDGTLVHPHDDDFQRVYAQRTDVERAWDLMEDGKTPYWVDTHALRMTRRLAKRVKKIKA